MTLNVDRSLRLPASEYFAEPQRKTGIAIHHTVCDSARTTLALWQRDKASDGHPSHVATAFVIDKDGTIYEAFNAEAWAYQFGLGWPDDRRIPFEKRFIGIEITSEGGLLEKNGRLYAYDTVSAVTIKPASEAFDAGVEYRGYRWFDRYEDDQLVAVGNLVNELCSRFPIPRVYPEKPYLYHGDALASFEGIIGHAMVRQDKSDPVPDPRLWQALRQHAGLTPTPISTAGAVVIPSARGARATALSTSAVDTLFANNTRRLDHMALASGSLVKNLLMELERRRTYIELATPDIGAHTIRYTLAQGDPENVRRVAHALGFQRVTDTLLEVRHA